MIPLQLYLIRNRLRRMKKQPYPQPNMIEYTSNGDWLKSILSDADHAKSYSEQIEIALANVTLILITQRLLK